jgi:hypothetical protein
MHENLLLSKLRSHCASSINAPAAPTQPTQIPKPSQLTAKEILGLRRPRTNKSSKEVSLEMEVDQYLSDPNEGSGDLLGFWQVRFYFLFYQIIN